jgi:hypothetical protein
MKKIPTIFDRDWDGDRSKVVNKPHSDCSWVFEGQGVATRKYDGTCCLIKDGLLFRRREVKRGKPDPENFVLAMQDETTGKRVGWVPVTSDKGDQWHREAFDDCNRHDGTYELVGPKVQGNPEKFDTHVLIDHDDAERFDAPTEFDSLRDWLADKDIEGLVWHHPDGRMAKIKLRDFGLKRPA